MNAKQISEAKSSAKFSQVVKRDTQNRPVVVNVPGHEGRRYDVIIFRYKEGDLPVLRCECLHSIQGQVHCAGGSKSFCYHCAAAVMVAVAESKKQVVFCQSEAKARKLSNLGGMVVKCVSRISGVAVWAVVK